MGTSSLFNGRSYFGLCVLLIGHPRFATCFVCQLSHQSFTNDLRRLAGVRGIDACDDGGYE
jgi:hypothetical protein